WQNQETRRGLERRLHSTGKPDAVYEGVDRESQHRHPAGYRRSCPVLVIVLATRLVIVVHLQLARYFVGVRCNEALDAKEANGAKGHPPAETLPCPLHGVRHDMKE